MLCANCLIEEYRAIREEIARYLQFVFVVLLADVTATAAFVGYGVQAYNPIVALSPFAILVPSLFLMARRRSTAIRAAMYVQVFIEPHLGIRWESRLLELRKIRRKRARLDMARVIGTFIGAMTLICLATAAYTWKATGLSFGVWGLFAVIVFVFEWFGYRAVRESFSFEDLLRHKEGWEKVRDAELAEPQTGDMHDAIHIPESVAFPRKRPPSDPLHDIPE